MRAYAAAAALQLVRVAQGVRGKAGGPTQEAPGTDQGHIRDRDQPTNVPIKKRERERERGRERDKEGEREKKRKKEREREKENKRGRERGREG